MEGPQGSLLSDFLRAAAALVDLEREQDTRILSVEVDPTDTGRRRAVVTLQRGKERPHPVDSSLISDEADWAI